MLGVSMAAVTGHLLTDLICGRTPIVDPTPYSPGRFA
jgi:D-amino-acid dehydrogenase